MSVRYTRVFTLPNDLYAEGCPLMISAGALLKDNQTGRMLVQLKIKNIGTKRVKAAKVCIQPMDIVGAPLGDEVAYKYLDLNAGRDEEFGQKTLIPLPDNEARAYTVRVSEVAFEDNATWTGDTAPVQLGAPKTLSDVLRDPELIKQYKLKYGADAAYEPKEQLDLWYCTCGALNHKGEECHQCGLTLDFLQSFDLAALTAEKDARLAQEKAEQEAKEAAAKARAESAKKTKKALIIVAAVIAVVVAAVLIVGAVKKSNAYQAAEELFINEQYDESIAAFTALGDYKDSAERVEQANTAKLAAEKKAEEERIEAEKAAAYADAEKLLAQGEEAKAAVAFNKLSGYKDAKERSLTLWDMIAVRETVSAGYHHTVGLKSDGTVVAVGQNDNGQCKVSGWTDIVAVSAGGWHTVGLKSDGTVVAVGYNDDGRCKVSDWTDIVAVSARSVHTVGLKADGTVIATGSNKYNQCDVSGWTDIVAVSAGGYHTVGLKSDGTVVAVGDNGDGQCNVSGWTDIVAVSAGYKHTVGLKSDGTVVAVGYNDYGECDVSGWTDIVAVSAGGDHTVGLKSDGTVIATEYTGNQKYNYGQCNVSGWTDIVAVSAGRYHTVGLKSDGTVVAVGYNGDGQCDVSGWRGIKLPTKP